MAQGNDSNPSAAPTYPEVPLKVPVEQLRAKLMADPEVSKQAALLKLPIEQYVEKIIDYARHPSKPPQLVLTPDEELKARDPKIPTQEEIGDYLQKVKSGEIAISPAHQRDGFKNNEAGAPTNFEKALGSADSLQGKSVESAKSPEEVGLKKDNTFKP